MATYILGTGGHARALARLYQRAIMVPEGTQHKFKGIRNMRNTVLVGWLGQSPQELRQREADIASLMVNGILVSLRPQIMLGAVVCESASLDFYCVINQGAIVCHDCKVGHGAHIGPGAVLCGGVRVGAWSMVGAGAVVLPNADIPPETLVKAGTRWPK